MAWRPLRSNETDHERLWLLTSLAGLALAGWWLRSGWPTPLCAFHRFTGLPCPSCGSTRAVRLLFAGDLPGALLMNPLCVLGAGALTVFNLYAATVLVGGWRRLRIENIPASTATRVRWLCLALLGLQWAWLILQKR